MSRSPWVRITLSGHEQDSWAELNIPASEVISGLTSLVSSSTGSFELLDFYKNGDGIKVILEKVPKKTP